MNRPLRSATRRDAISDWWPRIGLSLAGLVVGLAIVAEGSLARTLNGVGAVLWLIAAIGCVRTVLHNGWHWPTFGVAAIVIVLLALAVRPRDLELAAGGFLIGGAIVAAVGRRAPLAWALLVPALWLPAHLLRGIVRGLLTEGGQVRTEPPPTAALVPLVMVLAALAGGLIVVAWQRRTGGPPSRLVTAPGSK